MFRLALVIPVSALALATIASLWLRTGGGMTSAKPLARVHEDEDPLKRLASHVFTDTMAVHRELTPLRVPKRDDSLRALQLTATIRQAIWKYRDTMAAVADGYQMVPDFKAQPIYHFTNRKHALLELVRFNPKKPTSILYRRSTDGAFHLIGAMYTTRRTMSIEGLNRRVPLSIGRWHKHVRWCMPPKGDERRWSETRDGRPLFGPQSLITTEAECDAAGGVLKKALFTWMLHANVYEGNDLASIWGDEHGMAGRPPTRH